MKFSLWTNNGALNSKPVFTAFGSSLLDHGHTFAYNDMDCDVDVIWSVLWNGRMAPNKTIWERAKSEKRPIIVLEVGGIKRGTTWKVGINGINREANFGPKGNDDSRVKKLGLKLQPWQKNPEGSIIIAGQHQYSNQWRNQSLPTVWVAETIEQIRKYTGRRIVIRPHPRSPMPGLQYEFENVVLQTPTQVPNTYDDFDFDTSNAYAVVNWSSNPASQAVINGIPVFVGPDSLAWDVGNPTLNLINNPMMPDRTQWLNDLAYTEWTLEEIEQGLPLKRLTSYL